MPTYEFACDKCRKTFAEKQTFEQHDRHTKVNCPKCGGTTVHRVIASTFAKTSKKS